jgi:hypothetical protein
MTDCGTSEVSVTIRGDIEQLLSNAGNVETLQDDLEDRFERLQTGIDNIADIAAAERLGQLQIDRPL